MSNNAPARVRNSVADPDPRVARTTHALGRALIELIQERDYDEITVQQILDRAGVGRATFYAHYRNKDDALHSSYEGLFRMLEALLVRRSTPDRRLFPVAEFVAHIAEARELASALRRSGLLDEMWESFTGHATAIIERRLAGWPPLEPDLPRPLAARMLAGALLEMVRWYQQRPTRASPQQVDAAFHAFARGPYVTPPRRLRH
jgi:AcrR family transcriptional regulator